jgi:hypothetical protein
MSTSPAEMRVLLRSIVHEPGLFVDDIEERSQRIAAEAERKKFKEHRDREAA